MTTALAYTPALIPELSHSPKVLDVELMLAAASIVAHGDVYLTRFITDADLQDMLRDVAEDAVFRLSSDGQSAPDGTERAHADALSLAHIQALLNHRPGLDRGKLAQAILASRGSVTSWWARKLGAGS